LVDKVVGEQHHVTGHGKGHEEKKEQSLQKEVSNTTATGWMWFLAIFRHGELMSSCWRCCAAELQRTSVGFLMLFAWYFLGFCWDWWSYRSKQWMNAALEKGERCAGDVANSSPMQNSRST